MPNLIDNPGDVIAVRMQRSEPLNRSLFMTHDRQFSGTHFSPWNVRMRIPAIVNALSTRS
jgi:hypothetical protein